MNEWRLITTAVFCMAFPSLVGFTWMGCAELEAPKPKFAKGQIVYSVLDGRKGQIMQVLAIGAADPDYKVRFATATIRTDTHLLSEDGSLKTDPYVVIWMEECELSAEPPEKGEEGCTQARSASEKDVN